MARKKFDLKRLLLITIGVFAIVAGVFFFLMPNDIAVGGLTGLGMLINTIYPKISVGVFMLVANMILFYMGIKLLGKDFGGYTLYASALYSLSLAAMEKILPNFQPLSDDILINLIFGIFIQGVGVGFVINNGAATGGTDIIGKIVEKYTNLSFSVALMIADGIVTLGAAFIYGPELGMYALLGVIMNATVVDKILSGFNILYNIIITSPHNELINDYIVKNLGRSTTLYTAEGGYSRSKKCIIQTVVDRRQYIKLREFIRQSDPAAFMYVSKVSEVEGEGFTFELNENNEAVKMKK